MIYQKALLFSLASTAVAVHGRAHSHLSKRFTFPLPSSEGTVTFDEPQIVSGNQTFDGGMKTYGRGVECTGDDEGGDSDAVFRLEDGATLKNAIIGADQIEGVHCDGSCTVENVWWEKVCEDALSLKTGSGPFTVIGGGAQGADDKVIQHNGGGTVSITGFTVYDFGKLYRSCGNCDEMSERHVTVAGVTAVEGKTLVGINSNYGDTATIKSDVCATDVGTICQEYEGNDTGDEPGEIGEGPSDACAVYIRPGQSSMPELSTPPMAFQRERKRKRAQNRADKGGSSPERPTRRTSSQLGYANADSNRGIYATPSSYLPAQDGTDPPPPPAYTNPYSSSTSNGGFMGRAHYFHDTEPLSNTQELPYVGDTMESPTEDDIQLLQLQHAFDLPPRAIRDGLIDTFMKRCAPWMPIVERSWLEDDEDGAPSVLLLQSVFLAASRLTAAPAVTAYASSRQFYRRAKALFWSGWEKNPLTVVASVCILHWYNPEGPERVSTNTSGFWRYVAVGLAHQIGLHKEPVRQQDRSLRRRLWWSLFARDCLISAGQGRPLAVDMSECEIRPPCADDFKESTADAGLFASYVEICSVLGNLTRHCRRNALSRDARQSIHNSLYRWSRELPPSLRLFQLPGTTEPGLLPVTGLSSYNFEARQLHIPYFVCLTIICRPATPASTPSAAAILASSSIAAIFEDFLARDEVQYLGSIFTFHLLAAGTGLLSSKRYPRVWERARKDLHIIYISLEELAKRWPSATGALRALKSLEATHSTGMVAEESPMPSLTMATEYLPFFRLFGASLSWAWDEFMSIPGVGGTYQELSPHAPVASGGVILPSIPAATTVEAPGTTGPPPHSHPHNSNSSNPFLMPDLPRALVHEEAFHVQYEGMGGWLLDNYDWSGELPW
ncbi:hypothetical protein FE257_008587 [Aspergillus nanangensis]|uniref:pectate lyase n=1 Tax=Aspergillus nanangensis TaxID=2582783 RepID=A0AAD4CL13_ASPNN|nr:hypothetical protein FE257_008587 [Aspergillus nanangensis]